jgi:hypothetical protein
LAMIGALCGPFATLGSSLAISARTGGEEVVSFSEMAPRWGVGYHPGRNMSATGEKPMAVDRPTILLHRRGRQVVMEWLRVIAACWFSRSGCRSHNQMRSAGDGRDID